MRSRILRRGCDRRCKSPKLPRIMLVPSMMRMVSNRRRITICDPGGAFFGIAYRLSAMSASFLLRGRPKARSGTKIVSPTRLLISITEPISSPYCRGEHRMRNEAVSPLFLNRYSLILSLSEKPNKRLVSGTSMRRIPLRTFAKAKKVSKLS